jgi:hypothetical protein
MLRQIPEMVLHAGKQSLPEPWVLILDVEGRLDGLIGHLRGALETM